MSKKLVVYFSASGVTKQVAQKIANVVDGDLMEIEPAVKYSDADLDWHNKQSRSSKEMTNRQSRPAMIKKDISLDQYDTILIGFPVWWYTAPTIINTFIESYDFSNVTLIPFCTSGGTEIDGCEKDLRANYSQYQWKKGKRFIGNEDDLQIQNWING